MITDTQSCVGRRTRGRRRTPARVARRNESWPSARRMKPGSVLVDIAIDQGGCAETSRPTTHENPTYIEEGVTHYCVANMPGAYARTATQALTNVTYRYIEMLADLGLKEACQRQPAIIGGINVMDGKVTHKAVADAHGLPYVAPTW